MNVKLKRIFCVFLAALMIVLCVLPAYAAETSATSRSEVYADLQKATVNGKAFDLEDYPQDSGDGSVQLITLDEQGYGTSDYGVYLYLYNPSGAAIDVSSGKNKIELATAWTEESVTASEWSKFNLEFVSVSHEPGYAYVFYKVRIGAETDTGKSIKEYLHSSHRTYDIGGIELKRFSVTNAIDFDIGKRFVVSGTDAKKNKTTAVSKIDTEQIEVHHTYFRTESSASGVGHSNQLNAVYFNVDRKYWEEYERLYSIQCEWYEYRTTPMIVTDSAEVSAELARWLNTPISSYNSNNPVSMYSLAKSSLTGSRKIYNWTYNFELINNALVENESREVCQMISWLFFKDKIELGQTDVSSQEVLEYFNENKDHYDDFMLTKENIGGVTGTGAVAFPDRVAGLNKKDIKFNDTFEMKSYSSNHGWLATLLSYNMFNGGAGVNTRDDYSGIQAIEVVDDKYVNQDAEVLARMYYINLADAEDFKATVSEGVREGKVTVVFRFAVTDYFAEEVTATVNGVVPTMQYEGKTVDTTTYRAVQTFFRNFDIISMTFQKDESFVKIPVVSSPTDFVGGIDSPKVDKDPSFSYAAEYAEDEIWPTVKKMLMIFLAVACVVLLVYCWPAIMQTFGIVSSKVAVVATKAKAINAKRKKMKKKGERKK